MRKGIWKKRLLSLLTVLLLVGSVMAYTRVKIGAEVKQVVVTKVDIPPRTEITQEMLTSIAVPVRGVPNNAIQNQKDIVGKWTVSGYGLSTNSFLYADKIVAKDKLPDAGILALQEHEVAFPLLVDLETSLGNSIIPNSRVDLYFRSLVKDKNQATSSAIYGKVATQVRVVAVKDADADHVFDEQGNTQAQVEEQAKKDKHQLAKIYIFALPKERNELVNKAKLLGEIIPVATGQKQGNIRESKPNEVMEWIEQSSYRKEQPHGKTD